MDSNDASTGTFEVVSATGRAVDFQGLNPDKIILLLTPVTVSDTSLDRKIVPQAQDPFEAFGKKLSRKHSRVRHVPYLAKAGLTETHYAFAREAGAIIYVTMRDGETKIESAELYLAQARQTTKADRRTNVKPIIHLRFSADQERADSPQAELVSFIYPNNQDFDAAIKLLYAS